MRRRTAALVLVPALAAPAAALAHNIGANLGYHSRVTAISPAVPGLTAKVIQGDDQIVLTNDSGKTVIVRGYQNEPYLRFSPKGVDVNHASPAFWLNLDRYGQITPPPGTRASARPAWYHIGSSHTWHWHDHRIHWMSVTYPPAIAADKGHRHHVFDWTVPISVDGSPASIRGSLDYVPPKSGGTSSAALFGGIAAGVVLGGLLLWLGLRSERRRRRA